MNFPTFDYRAWYKTDVDSLEQIEALFFNENPHNDIYYRGMANYDFICISTFYRYYINSRRLDWREVDVGFNAMVNLPEIDENEYKNLSFSILDDFYTNMLDLGSVEISYESIAYLAQHYGLPTDLIDFSYDPKIALYFACCELPESDCSIYMFDIYSHVKNMMALAGQGPSAEIGYMLKEDGTHMTNDERAQVFKDYCTTLSKDGASTVTPIIKGDDIRFSERIINQKGAFIYHRSEVPMDQLMYTASTDTYYSGRRIYKITKELKPQILQILDERFGINKAYIYPSMDLNLTIIDKAASMTKEKFNL
ncbi:FRG domain-containing protein [Pseudoalteromonas sp. 2CM39R]|uniref:FRG domain-containing protein n=1 Tax=Pseudoalteromonas sp. 2CM39R TaxID=2929856 RepID=UPI0020BE8507|nr:FRG domain-containing protein [Pseudoalteromonas sp. 2CM39R]MCK8124474.1 FRG domain-containing protein [Pseudoalteromonas sp. 2CM39R]